MNMKIKDEQHLDIEIEKLIRDIQQAAWNNISELKKKIFKLSQNLYLLESLKLPEKEKNQKARKNPKLSENSK